MHTKNDQKEFSKESIDIYLKKLSKVYKKLSAGRMPAEIILVGGSAIAVNYSFRQSSTDIDAIIQAPDVMRFAGFVMKKICQMIGLTAILQKQCLFRRCCGYTPSITGHFPILLKSER